MLQAQFEALGKTMQTAMKNQFPNGSATYKQQLDQVKNLQTSFNELAMSSGAYSVESVKAVSATQALSKSIADQKLTLSGALSNLKNFQAGWREQAALQKASIMQWTNSTTGKNQVDLYMPKELTSDLDSFRTKYGYINQAIGSIATQTINWGKNTQWAGRQITVGIGMPLAMIAAAMAKSAYTADQDLTKITKVYNTSTDQMMTADQQQISTQNQLAQVRKNAMQDAITMAQQYGQSLTETLQTEADLAAVGKTGNDLRATTAQVTRVATLGELDHNTALQMTISLQNAFGLSTQKLGQAFNYINDIENTTSLTTQDFATAIPKVASAIASMGGSVQDAGVLMVAMKQGGVDAAQGANALKSAVSRLIKPTQQAQDALAGMGIDIKSITLKDGGNLMKTLEDLGAQMQNLTPMQKEQAMATLFGTYQFNKLNVALSNVSTAYQKYKSGVKDANDQTLQAITVAGQDPSQWQAVGDQEQKQLQQSISFQWKSTIAQIQTQMAILGQTVIKALLPVGKAVLNVVKWFNSWGDTSKKIALWVAGLTMLAGPAIMLLGLFGNLAGNVAKFASSMSNLVLRFKVLDPEQRASELMAKQAASAFDSEAGSIARLNLEMQNLVKTQLAMASANGVQVPGLTGAAATIAQQMGAAPVNNTGKSASGAPLPIVMSNGRYKHPTTGKFMSTADANAMKQAAVEADAMAAGAAKTSASFGSIVGKLGMFGIAAFSLKSMVDSSGGLVSNLLSASVFVAAMAGSGGFKLIGKTILGIPGLLKTAMTSVTTLIGRGLAGLTVAWQSAGGSWKSIIGAVGTSLGKFAISGLGIAAILAGAVALYTTINNKMSQGYKQQQAINNSTKDWASILGYAEKSFSNMSQGGGSNDANSPTAWQARAAQVSKMNKDMVAGLQAAYNNGKGVDKVYSMAVDEAFKVKLDGGSAAQAKRAFEIALQAAGVTKQQFDTLDVKFNDVNVDDTAAIQKHVKQQLTNSFKDLGTSVSAMEPSVLRPFSDLSHQAEKAASGIGGAFSEALNAANNLDDVKTAAKTLTDGMNKSFQDEFSKIGSTGKNEFKKYGIKNAQEYFSALQQAWADAAKGTKYQTKEDNDLLALYNDDGSAAKTADTMRSTYSKALDDVKSKLHMTDADMKKLADSGYNVADIVKIIGQDYLGLSADASTGAAGAINAMNNLGNATQNVSYTAEQITTGLQNTMKGYMNDVYSEADNIMSEQYQNQIDGINRAGQARQKVFDAQSKALQKNQQNESDALKASQDARSKAYDDQIKQVQDAATAQEDAIQAEIDAENKQDQVRQQLFDREKTRIERLAQMQNDSIDFNTALNSGNMDQAAKLYNTHAATVQGYQIDDQNTAASAALKARTDAQSAQIDAIKKATDATVAQLQTQKDALQSVFDLESKLLQEKQQNEQDALDAAKQADSDRTASAVANAQRRQAMNKLELDQEVMALKAQTPRTQAEAQDQINKLQAVYQKYGVNLQANGEEWSQYIANDLTAQVSTAAAQLQNDFDWQTEGNNISQLLAAGSGLSVDQLKSFLATGQWPAAAAPKSVNPATGFYVGADGKIHKGNKAMHSGGFSAPSGKLSWGQKERMGVPANAGMFQSEIPTLLKHGEYVVNDKATATNLPLLNAINSGVDVMSLLHGAHHMGGIANFAEEQAGSFGTAAYLTLANRMVQAVNGRLAAYQQASGKGASYGPAFNGGGLSGNVLRWKSTVDQALSMLGLPTNVDMGVLNLIAHESGGNPNAINLWDSNAKAGHPSQGLMQTIPSTFMAHAGTLAGRGILDPLANIYAGIDYAFKRYGIGMLAAGGRHDANGKYLGYDNGGWLQSGSTGFNHSGKPEPVFTADQWATLSSLVSSAGNVMQVAGKSGAFDSGTTNHYDVTIDLRGATVKDEIDFTKCVKNALYEIENKNGLNRKVGDGS